MFGGDTKYIVAKAIKPGVRYSEQTSFRHCVHASYTYCCQSNRALGVLFKFLLCAGPCLVWY